MFHLSTKLGDTGDWRCITYNITMLDSINDIKMGHIQYIASILFKYKIKYW